MSRWRYHLPILGYHRVGPFRPDHVPTVSAEAFARQLRWLTRWGYQVVSLDEVVARLERRQPLPRRRTVITFDDGYEETCSIAWPLLKRFGMTATVFVTPNEVGLPGFATWDQLQALARGGITIGSHTLHHCYLPLVEAHRLPDEIAGSKRVLEDRLQQPVQYLSYPVGGFNPRVQALVQEAGYRAACTTNRAEPRNGLDRFALRRIKVNEQDANPVRLLAKLSGYYDLFRRVNAPA